MKLKENKKWVKVLQLKMVFTAGNLLIDNFLSVGPSGQVHFLHALIKMNH